MTEHRLDEAIVRRRAEVDRIEHEADCDGFSLTQEWVRGWPCAYVHCRQCSSEPLWASTYENVPAVIRLHLNLWH